MASYDEDTDFVTELLPAMGIVIICCCVSCWLPRLCSKNETQQERQVTYFPRNQTNNNELNQVIQLKQGSNVRGIRFFIILYF